jgi:MerR family Zn(II)-responsive transcriptional regulator of zntA
MLLTSIISSSGGEMFKIQEFSQKTGVSKRMLRYLEDQGLLMPSRKGNDYRIYQSHHLEEIRWIQFWQRLGFSLLQIKSLKNLSPSKFEGQLEELLERKKQELASHSTQVSTIRGVIKKIRDLDQCGSQLDLRKDFNSVETWTASVRDEFFTQIINQDRVVYGKFPEMESVVDSTISQMKTASFNLSVKSCEIMKVGGALQQLPSTEVIVWERKSDYTYFFAAIPENILSEDFADHFEDSLYSAYQVAIDSAFYPGKMHQVGRLFNARDILQISASHEITFRCTLTLKWNDNLYDFFTFVPFQFVHASRNGLSHESSGLGRTLQKSVLELTDEQILDKTKQIPNQDYLITAFLVDAETRHKMFNVLSAEAKQSVMKDMAALVEGIRTSWSDQ